ncbi:hypothetical protein WJX82_001954 [Trebouxia sp. C0006]
MSQIKPASGPAFVGKTQGNTPNLFWRRISFDQLRSQSQYVGLPPPDQLHLECIADYRNVRQESQLWTELHQGLLTTGRLNAALGFYEPAAAKRLGIPRDRALQLEVMEEYEWHGEAHKRLQPFLVSCTFSQTVNWRKLGCAGWIPQAKSPLNGDSRLETCLPLGRCQTLDHILECPVTLSLSCKWRCLPLGPIQLLLSADQPPRVLESSGCSGTQFFCSRCCTPSVSCTLGILPSSANQCIFGNVYVGSNLPSELSFVASMRAVYTVLAQQQAFDTTAMRWAKKEKLQIDSSGWKCYIRLDATDHPIDYSSLGVLAKKRRKGN